MTERVDAQKSNTVVGYDQADTIVDMTGKRTVWLRKWRPDWARPEHPVYQLEQRRRTQSRVVQILQAGCLPTILAVSGLTGLVIYLLTFPVQITSFIEGAATGTLGALLGVTLLLQVLAGAAVSVLLVAQTAPLISGEVELQSWGVLRSTALTLREIVLAKYASALNQMRGSLLGLLILRAISTISGLLLLLFLLTREIFYYMSSSEMERVLRGEWIPPFLAGLLFIVWYASQPIIQTMLNGALGVLASSLTKSRGRAIATALAARLVLWVSSIIVNGGSIYLLGWLIFGNWAYPSTAPIEAFHTLQEPSNSAILIVTCAVIIIYVLILMAWQMGLIFAALKLTERYARSREDA